MMARDRGMVHEEEIAFAFMSAQEQEYKRIEERNKRGKKYKDNLFYAPADNMRFPCIALGAVQGGLFAQSISLKAVSVAAMGVTIPGWMIGALTGCVVACLLLAVLNYCNRRPTNTYTPAEAIAQRRGQPL